MSNSIKKPYYHYVCFDNKTQRFFRNKSRRTIRRKSKIAAAPDPLPRKSKIALRRCLTEPDIDSADYVYRAGTSFKDGFDEWTLPSDGHQVYLRFISYGRKLPYEEREEIKKRAARK